MPSVSPAACAKAIHCPRVGMQGPQFGERHPTNACGFVANRPDKPVPPSYRGCMRHPRRVTANNS